MKTNLHERLIELPNFISAANNILVSNREKNSFAEIIINLMLKEDIAIQGVVVHSFSDHSNPPEPIPVKDGKPNSYVFEITGNITYTASGNISIWQAEARKVFAVLQQRDYKNWVHLFVYQPDLKVLAIRGLI